MDNTVDFKKANEYSLKCMRVTMIVMVIAWILNVLNIFILDQNIMNHALVGLIIFISCGYLVKFTLGFEKTVSNYVMLFLLVGMITFANSQLSYHGTLFMLFPMVCSILYNHNKYITYTFILTCIGFLGSVLGGFAIGLCDANMLILTTSTVANESQRLLSGSYEMNSDVVSLVLFYVIPRCMALVGFTSVLNYIKNSIQEKTLHEQESLRIAETERLANQAKSRFLAQMSHEIRTPINAVLGMNEMILHKADDSEILDYSSNIKKAGKNLLVLVNGILDFSKIEDGKMELLPVKYKMNDMIENLRISVEQRAKEKGIEFVINADKNLPNELYGDDLRISQVIINLLTNAVKYTKKGSVTLDIKTESRIDDKITLFIQVSDTGIGIREEDLPRLFTSFERLEENKNRTIEGSGLGLSITTKLLEMMDSKLEVKSTYGVGSKFYFSLVQTIVDDTPIEKTAAASKSRLDDTENTSESIYPDAKILVVDDNEMNLKVIKNLLGLFKITPDLESSGAGAVSKMKENDYDIVFMDHMMPEMDGIETLKKLREQNLVPEHTVMIALTANAIVGAREIYMNATFDDYLTKPIELEQLCNVFDRYLPDEKKKEDEEILEFMPGGENDENDSYEDNDVIERAKDIGLNTDDGLKYCANDIPFYKEMISDFVSLHQSKIKTLCECFEKEDWNDYRIYVHALKSNLHSIGALKLSEEARILENAADSGEIIKIREKHPAFVEEYNKLAKDIDEKVLH